MYRITENPPERTEGARQNQRAGETFFHRLRGVCTEQMEGGFGGAQSKRCRLRQDRLLQRKGMEVPGKVPEDLIMKVINDSYVPHELYVEIGWLS